MEIKKEYYKQNKMQKTNAIFLSLAHSALATLASVLFLDLGGPAPILGPLYCLVPLPGTFFPQISACTAKSFTSIKTLLKCHLLNLVYPDYST